MRAQLVEASLWGIALAMTAVALVGWRRTMHYPVVAAPMIWSAPSPDALPSPDSLAVLTMRIVDHDIFRLGRTPATVAYEPATDSQPVRAAPPPAPPKPALALAGIVGGPPWAALLDGVPGHDGSLVVHRGDSVAGLRVRAVSPTGVVLSGLDTTWHLVVKHPWP